MTQANLKEILQAHQKWLQLNAGCRADLSGANLSDANLRGADLSDSNLRGADLSDANLRGADLSDANLSGADLSDAYLRHAYLSRADLSDTNLSGADLSGADLSGADLSGVSTSGNTLFYWLSCPESGEFTAYKKCRDNVIVTLLITADAKRSSATSRKCRASKAVVIAIESSNGVALDIAHSKKDVNFKYRLGETVEVADFNEDRWVECSTGIHFFITKQEAIQY